MLNIIVLTFCSGVIGTGLGGVVGAFIGNKSEKHYSMLLSFSGGIMISVVCFDLIPESIKLSDIFLCSIFSVLGVILVMIINYIIDRRNNLMDNENLKLSNNRLLRSGILLVIVIGIHNFPEGLAVGSSLEYNYKMGVLLTLLIAFHNIPEGMAISAPLVSGSISKVKAIIITALSGVPTILGATIGHFIGTGSDIGVSFSLAFASGAMLYIVFYELIPQSVLMGKSNLNSFFILIGMLLGLIVIQSY